MSLIQSNAAGFGSGVLDAATGVHFQDRGASFSLDPAHPNVLEPRKRTAHTLLPGMLFRDGERRPWVVAGSMGGDIQPQIHAQLVSALVDGGADIRTAVAAPRVVVEPAGWFAPPVAVLADGELAPGVAAELAALGHEVGRRAYRRQPRPRARDRARRRRPGRGRDPGGDRGPAFDGARRGPLTPREIARDGAGAMLSSAGRWQAALTPICCRHSSASRRGA